MTMKADWALFRWAHTYGYSQVDGSLQQARISSLIAKWSDVPSGADSPDLPERAWAAWRLEDRYMLVRSVPDQEEARGGGYISRALILPADQASELTTLRPLFDLLERPDRFWTEQANRPIELDTHLPVTVFPAAVTALLAAYTKRGVSRVVLLDSPQTPTLLSGLWQALWPAARLNLSFKTYFTPIQVSKQDTRPQLIISPSSAARWEAHGYETVGPTVQVGGSTFVKHLTGETDTLAATLLKAYPGGLIDLPMLTVLHRQVEAALMAKDVWSVLVALDTLQGVPVAAESRTSVSDQLYRTLVHRVPDLPATELLRLNRLSQQPLLISAIECWITNHLLFEPELSKVLEHPSEPWFRLCLEAGVANIAPSTVAAGQIWEHWPLLREYALLPTFLTDTWSPALASTLPQEPADDIRAVALQHRLLEVYAALVGREAHPVALRDVLHETTPEDQPVVLQDLRVQWGKRNFIRAGAQLNDPRLDPFMTELLEQDPELFQLLDPTQASWRRWWTQRVMSGVDVWDGVSERATILDRLLGLDPVDWPPPLLSAIADTPQANLLGQPRRPGLWGTLPIGFLKATARAWLDAGASPEDVEAEVLDEALAQISGQIPPALAITLLRLGLPQVSLTKLDLILQSARAPWPEDLVALLQRRAEQSGLVQDWFDRGLSERYDLPAEFFAPFFERLRPVQQVRYLRGALKNVPEDLWWRALREKALATFGEELDRVWSDIGGKHKHLQEHGSREERWFYAINRIRDKGQPKFDKLLAQIGDEDHLSDDSAVLWETRPH